MNWFAFRAFNSQTQYGYGSAEAAERYADILNIRRSTGLFCAHELSDTDAAEEELERRDDTINLDDIAFVLADEISSRSELPSWAVGSIAFERDGYGYECHVLIRDHDVVGWVYDDGAGYRWSEGLWGEPDRV